MIRYRDRSFGLTRKSVNALKHVERLGEIKKIIGYRYKARCKFESGFLPVMREAVKVFGENGYAVFSGFCWGYGGEGPRGLHQLLLACKLHETIANNVAFKQPRYFDVGIDWEVEFEGNHVVTTTNYRPKNKSA